MADEDDDLWGSDDDSGNDNQGEGDGDDAMNGSAVGQSQPLPEDNDVDMDGNDSRNHEDDREPVRNGDAHEGTAKLDFARMRTSSLPNTSSDIPANILRRNLFVPSKEIMDQHLLLDPFIVIPQPGHVHSMTATPCMSYLLTGSEDGHVRAYDFWASANGKNMLSTQQRSMATLGEGVNKGGFLRGYYKNEVEIEEVVGEEEEAPQDDGPALPWLQAAAQANKPTREVVKIKKMQPVYSLAIQGDALWAVSGTETGMINLTTIRHDPGKIVHVFDTPDRHTKAVSALLLTNDEQHLISGGWDNQVKEWDLNTGQVIRTFTKHKGPISAIQFRPLGLPAMSGKGDHVAITTQDQARPGKGADESADAPAGTGDMEDAAGSPDSYGSLFGDEEEEEGGAKKQEKEKPRSAEPAAAGVPLPNQNQPKSLLPSLIPGPSSSASAMAMPASRPGILSAGLKGQPRVGLPPLAPETYRQFSDDVMLVASMDGEVALHDRRIESTLVGKLEGSLKSGPWCMSACFSADGTQVIAGRRNASLDVWDVRKGGKSGSTETPNLLRTLRHPATSQWVSAVAAFPDGKHIACASVDCVRLWNTADLWNPESNMKKSKSGVPFRIVAGHHGGTVSKIHIDPTGQYMVTATGNRGWAGDATKVVLVHERK